MRILLFIIASASLAQQIDAPRQVKNLPYVDVRTYGAKGDSTTNDTAAFQAAVNAVEKGGRVVVAAPTGSDFYNVCGLQLPSFVTLEGEYGIKAPSGGATQKPHLACASDVPVITQKDATAFNITVKNLYISGTSNSGSKGIYFPLCISCYITDNYVLTFGDQAIQWTAGYDGVIRNNTIQGCVVSSGRSTYCGALQVGATDVEITYNNIGSYACTFANAGNCPGPNTVVDGYSTAFYGFNGKHWIANNIFSFAEHGMVYAGGNSQIYANHSEYNLGHGYLITGASNNIVGNSAYTSGLSNGQDNTYDGFHITGGHNLLDNNQVETQTGLSLNVFRYGYYLYGSDSSAVDWANRIGITNQSLNATSGKYYVGGSTLNLLPYYRQLPNGVSNDKTNTLIQPIVEDNVNLAGANVQYRWQATDAAADNERWDISTNAAAGYSQLFGRVINDANTVASNWLEVDRTGTTVNSVAFPNGTMEFNKTVFFTNTVAFSGLVSYGKSAVVICSDCKATSPTNSECAGSGGGSPAYRVGTKWMCMDNTGAGDAIFTLGSGNSFGVKNVGGSYILQVTEAGAVTVSGADISMGLKSGGSFVVKDSGNNTAMSVADSHATAINGALTIQNHSTGNALSVSSNAAAALMSMANDGKLSLNSLGTGQPVVTTTGQFLASGKIDLANANHITGTLPVGNIPVGVASTQVAAGDHNHSGIYASKSVFAAACATLAKLTAGGSNGSLCWNDDGQITSYTAPN